MLKERKSGLLLHITSLAGDECIGSLGDEAYKFVDFLSDSGMKYWQILPINALYFTDCPYTAISSIANNIYLISLNRLKDYGLIPSMVHIYDENAVKINFEKTLSYKQFALKKAFDKFKLSKPVDLYSEYISYCDENKTWLDDYALFVAIKEYYIYKRRRDAKADDLKEFNEFKDNYKRYLTDESINAYFYGGLMCSWEERLIKRDEKALATFSFLLEDNIYFYKFTQFLFDKQWKELKAYANDKGIEIIGDLPIFINYDSADIWTNPELFYLEPNHLPTELSGCPPDYFQEDGQFWGNPLYNWKVHKSTGYAWWKKRLDALYKHVDIVRIDHFRAFESNWAIPQSAKTAREGVWRPGPGKDIFKAIAAGREGYIIAEDLGIITKEVENLRKELDLPGMFVAHFHLFDYLNKEELNKKLDKNMAAFTGTHDNQTSVSWYNELPEERKEYVASFAGKESITFDVYDLIKICMDTPANTCIIPVQDILELDDSYRMNYPGTVEGNWGFRLPKGKLTSELATKLKAINTKYNRI